MCAYGQTQRASLALQMFLIFAWTPGYMANNSDDALPPARAVGVTGESVC